MWDKVDFLLADKHKSFLQDDCITMHAQSTQNNRGLQYVKENEKDEVDFLPDNKRWRFAIILIKMVKYSQSSENSMFAMSLLYLKKEVRDKVYLLHADKFSYKLISTLWASKFSTRWYYHYWWAWSSILKVLKVTSL